MRLKINQAPYIARQIALELSRTKFIKLNSTLESLISTANELIQQNMKIEQEIEYKVNEIINDNQDEIDDNQADAKQLFSMIKKKIAKEYNFNINFNERYSELSHEILDAFVEQELIECEVSETKIKNIIFDSFNKYLKIQDEAQNIVLQKIKNYKRKLIPGSDEYELLFQRMYDEELRRKL